ncbi:hypothetical protein [Enterococcus sp. DIV1420a]|uniref:hypothetical protein n=1 Tax=Enterococcus sp. DIV1420a TaxID=2774672 RepID=UPI0036D69A18
MKTKKYTCLFCSSLLGISLFGGGYALGKYNESQYLSKTKISTKEQQNYKKERNEGKSLIDDNIQADKVVVKITDDGYVISLGDQVKHHTTL